jgi:hypothetical protein
MVYVSIPYIPENNRLDKNLVKKEIEILVISDNAKQNAYAAIYNLKPRGVDFEGQENVEAARLENVLSKLGVPYIRLEESEY